MAEFKIDRFKYNWKGSWEPATEYKRDDIARVNGRSYVCIKGHISAGAFGDDLNATLPGSEPPQPDPRWIVMTVSKSFIGNWTIGTDYNKGDLVLLDGTVWLCIAPHNAIDFATDVVDKWEVFTKSISFVGIWTESTTYGHGALVKYNGYVYKCLNAHLSGTTLEDNIDDWLEFHVGNEYRNAWIPETVYRKNDLVRYGASVFRCTATHTSGSVQIDDNNFVLEFPGTQFDGEWTSTTVYNIGDIVRYGGHVYYAVANNIDSDPSRIVAGYTSGGDSTQDWIILSKTYNFRGDWDINSPYKTGDIVTRGGYLYQILRDININDGDDSSLVYQDPEIYELLIPGKKFVGPWTATGYYSVGDIVYYLGTAYFCNFEHQATAENFPGDNGSGYDYWDILVQAGQPGGLKNKGDLLTFGLSRTGADDGSTVGDTNLPIAETGEVLSVTTDLDIFWRNFLQDSDVVYVSNEGINRPGYGGTPERPFRTIRYACEYIEDNFAPLSPTKVKVATGFYEEIGPIAIPAGCVVMGDELRATTISATPRIPAYRDEYDDVSAYITFVETFILDILTNVPVSPLAGNTETQVLSAPVASPDVAQRFVELFTDWKDYVNYYVFTGETNPTLLGSNTTNEDTAFVNGAANVRQNLLFISGQIYAYLVNLGRTPDKDRVYEDVNSLFRGIARDIEFSGNYGTLLSARRYSNAANGSQNDDLFWCRDTTGIRQCTMKGLVGALNPPGVFDLYQRPTGGAFTALDPGWGPDDNRVWINNRSPYIQGVTNIGSACVGKKVDGSLHNGGNKSMTSNDYTQVLSDGIGAWITDGGRAELVSVFTYYCAVGYFAEDGGIIRATNGNNSYGDYGSIADGNDPTEIPDTCTVWNRNNEAIVDTVESGGSLDTISVFEYEHCGEAYSEVTPVIKGAGAGVNVEYDDFRDLSIFNCRLLNTKGSGSEGGSNYLVRQGNAQETLDATSTLKLSQSDATLFESEIIGMRILIIQGTGYGQYGYIDGYDPVTRFVTIRKESNDELGWDHLIPGTPNVAALDSTARYRIEPRMEVSHPGFISNSINLNSERTFTDIDFGGMTETYGGLTGGTGTGETFGLPAVEAIFTVSRQGHNYVVTLNNGGAGYAVGDRLTITGDFLGGSSPDNDLNLDVVTVSDDSTNSITSFSQQGKGRGGRFVAIAAPNFVVYSDTGSSWQEANLDVTATWIKVLAENNRFLAFASNTNTYNFSYTGENWTTRALPATENWVDAASGPNGFVVIADNATTFAYSANGLTWNTSNTVGANTIDWKKIAYGQGRYVAIANDRSVTYSDNNGLTWVTAPNVLPAGTYDFVSLAYGDNRFIAMTADGQILYSVDKGATWYQGSSVPQNGGTSLNYIDCKYAQGVFLAISTDAGTPTGLCATSEDGINWIQNSLSATQAWSALTFATIDDVPKWVLLSDNATLQGVSLVTTGKKAKLRADPFTGTFQRVKIWDPGSGYRSAPDITVTDTQFITEVEIDPRIGNGVIAQPSFKSRGSGYRSTSTTVSITGDGYADIIPESNKLTIIGVDAIPGPGVQIRIEGILDVLTEDPNDLKLFNGVKITDLGDDGTGNNTRLVELQISPTIDNEDNLVHGTQVTLRSLYSQARITGHDFLDIGTGNFEQTNYPEVYADGSYFTAAPENEVYETNGGRVFYTSTDQDGNFRTGELFSVQQSTGIVTISAEFFDLDGLTELALGGVRLGGSGAAVRDFSTDPTMSEDSNNVVPTQRAIATFLADRLSVGGEDLETNRLVAGNVIIGGEENEFNMNNDGTLQIQVPVDLSGDEAGVGGTILSQMLVLRTFNDTTQ